MFADSRDVAACFGKTHFHVVAAIRELIAKGVTNFRETPYIHPQNGQSYTAFLMDRDGFTLLVMSFTGKKALQWKMAYIAAFNAMEAALTKPAPQAALTRALAALMRQPRRNIASPWLATGRTGLPWW